MTDHKNLNNNVLQRLKHHFYECSQKKDEVLKKRDKDEGGNEEWDKNELHKEEKNPGKITGALLFIKKNFV